MTVKELIEALAKMPPEMEVVKATSDGHYRIREIKQELFNEWECGSLFVEYYPEIPADEGDKRLTLVEIT
jgi:hypothetical protein